MKLIRPIGYISFPHLHIANLEKDSELQHVGRIISSVPFIAVHEIGKTQQSPTP